MTKLLLIIIFFAKIILGSSQIDELFQRANEHYLKGEFEQAIQSYNSILTQGYEGKSLYYNLGNSYFRAGKLGFAIYYYEKAKKLSPSDEDVNYNLAFANSRITDKIETLPKFFLFEWWENLLSLFSISGWTYVAYIFFLIILFAIATYFFAKSLKTQRLAFYGGIISALVFVIVIILLIINLNRELNIKYAIIVEQQVITKFSPDSNSGDAFLIHEGLKVKAEDTVSDWVKIRLIDGKVGWVKKESLKII